MPWISQEPVHPEPVGWGLPCPSVSLVSIVVDDDGLHRNFCHHFSRKTACFHVLTPAGGDLINLETIFFLNALSLLLLNVLRPTCILLYQFFAWERKLAGKFSVNININNVFKIDNVAQKTLTNIFILLVRFFLKLGFFVPFFIKNDGDEEKKNKLTATSFHILDFCFGFKERNSIYYFAHYYNCYL